MQGSYFLGLKYANPWKWENIWSLYALLALVVTPISLALGTIPHMSQVLGLAPSSATIHVFLYGAAWGIGSVLSGLGVARMGLAMGVAVLIGVQAVIGSFVPLVVNTPDLILQRKGLTIIAAVVTLLVGLALVAVAGKERDRSHSSARPSVHDGGFAVGLAICIFSGVFSAMLNLGFAFSQPLMQAAVTVGAKVSGALNAVWAIALAGGFIPNAIYTGYLLTRNKTWGHFTLPRTSLCWLVGLMMAVLWYGGILLYGRGATGIGKLGPVIGWPLFMAVIILTSSIWGFITGEWRAASGRAKQLMKVGLVVLIVASALLAIANRF
jgi:L-rhamnose-H+ transport protein